MTLLYVPWIHLYVGWDQCCSTRALHFCCTKKCLKIFMGCFELVWDWSDILPGYGAQANNPDRGRRAVVVLSGHGSTEAARPN